MCIVSHLAAVRIDLAGGEKICNLQSGQEQQRHHSLRHPTQLGRSEEEEKEFFPLLLLFPFGIGVESVKVLILSPAMPTEKKGNPQFSWLNKKLGCVK